MFPLIGGLLSGASNLLGSVFSANTSAQNTQAQIGAQEMFLGQSEEFNASQAQQARDFSAQQAQINRDYQTQMSSTAFQRARQDMEKAGLNPILAAGAQSSTPSGSMASGPSASVGTPSAPQFNRQSAMAGLGAAVNNAVNTAVQAKTFDKMTEEIANIRQDAALRQAETRLVEQRGATEVHETGKRGAEEQMVQEALPAARFERQQAEAKLALPSWLQSLVAQSAYVGTGAAKAISPINDLISGAIGARRAFLPSEGFRSGSSDGPKGTTTFDERFGAAFH